MGFIFCSLHNTQFGVWRQARLPAQKRAQQTCMVREPVCEMNRSAESLSNAEAGGSWRCHSTSVNSEACWDSAQRFGPPAMTWATRSACASREENAIC